jgi:hypothetical protein
MIPMSWVLAQLGIAIDTVIARKLRRDRIDRFSIVEKIGIISDTASRKMSHGQVSQLLLAFPEFTKNSSGN